MSKLFNVNSARWNLGEMNYANICIYSSVNLNH